MIGLKLLLNRLSRVRESVCTRQLFQAFFRYGVLVGAEHRFVLRPDLAMVVDIGANRGQFALAARRWSSDAKVVSFEPLPEAAKVFRKVFAGDSSVVLHQMAIGAEPGEARIHVSKRDDSSSLLPISPGAGDNNYWE